MNYDLHYWSKDPYYDTRNSLSLYSATNPSEFFAESFAAYTHPNYGKQEYPKIHPKLDAAFDRLFKQKK